MKIRMDGCLIIVLVAMLIGGCASSPDMVSTKRVEGEKYSADEVREMVVDQPFLLSGDYFRERTQKSRSLKELLNLGTDGKNEMIHPPQPIKQTAYAEGGPSYSSSTPISSKVASPLSLPVKVGFLLDRGQVSDSTENKIFRLIPDIAPAFQVLPVSQDQIHEALSISDCLEKKDLLCIAGTLSLFPGVQMLALIERFDVPSQFPGSTVVKLAMVDTGIPFRYPAMEITASVNDALAMEDFIKGVLHKIFDVAVAKSGVMPWFCRSFSEDDGKWYISAGERSGLTIGQQLQVMSGGRVVRTPGGLPAGWLPGTPTGTLKVDRFFGSDLAVCSLVTGDGPDPENVILLDR